MLFIDMGEVDYEPSQFLSSIDGERLHLIENGSGQADSIYLPKQITFFGMKSDALAEDLKTQLLRKGWLCAPVQRWEWSIDIRPISLSQATISSKPTSDIIWLPNLRRSCNQCLNQYHIPVTGSIVEVSILGIFSFIRTF